MKRLWMLFAVALIIGVAAPAISAEKSKYGGNVSLNYWIADISSEGENADQNFFPSLTAVVGVSPLWSVIGEYSDSDEDTSNLGTKIESKRYLIGARYDFENSLWYVDLAYQKTEVGMDDGAGTTASIDVDGIRLGGGFDYALEASPWSVNLDLGVGIANDADVSMSGVGAAGVDGDEVDVCLGFSYKFNEEGLKGNIGYRYLKNEASGNGGTLDLKSDGFFVGVGYDF